MVTQHHVDHVDQVPQGWSQKDAHLVAHTQLAEDLEIPELEDLDAHLAEIHLALAEIHLAPEGIALSHSCLSKEQPLQPPLLGAIH